jgi:hypothetical protein
MATARLAANAAPPSSGPQKNHIAQLPPAR